MDNIISAPIVEEMEQSFLDYSLSVITDRAIPSAEDGLKPVARRILWDMYSEGYSSDKKVVKCAKVVGSTMGRFHPHGDSSIYGALAWLSQPWTMRYPLVSFHGNNGSRDGDEPASARYTECKLSKIAEETLRDIKSNTVNWANAYTDDEQEPEYLTGLVPNLLVNGTSGIAVAMACSFAPHNLNEIMSAIIHVAQNPDCECKNLLEFVKGPDFPTGGVVINQSELINAYLTGKGRARIRGEYFVEKSEKGYDTIVFTSIPYKVSKEQVIIDLDSACEEKKVEGVSAIRDETNKDGVRLVIELSKGVAANSVIESIFAHTQLDHNYSFNQVALVDKSPKLLNLKELIEIYISHQKKVLLGKTNYSIGKINARLHILNGILIALEDIDNIIALIKKSNSAAAAKDQLMSKYKLSEIQAKAILDMKLSRLAHIEKVQIQDEAKELTSKLAHLNTILLEPTSELIRIFSEFKKTYGDERLTKIIQMDIEQIKKKVVKEECVVVLSEGGLIKRIPLDSFPTQRRNGKGIKNQEEITLSMVRTSTEHSLAIFTNRGKVYKTSVAGITSGTILSKGTPVSDLIQMEPEEKAVVIYSIFSDVKIENKYLYLTTKKGLLKKILLEDAIGKRKSKKGLSAMTLSPDDEIVSVFIAEGEDIVTLTKNGMIIRISGSAVNSQVRTSRGVPVMSLYEEDSAVVSLPIRDPSDFLAIFSRDGLGKKVALSEINSQGRGGKGLKLYNNQLVAAAVISDKDTVLVVGDKNSICLSGEQIPTASRTAISRGIIKDSQIVSVSKV